MSGSSGSRRGGQSSVRGSLHFDSFPCVTGGDAERLSGQLNDAVAALGTLLEDDQGESRASEKGPGRTGDRVLHPNPPPLSVHTNTAWPTGKKKASASPFQPRIDAQAAAPGSSSFPLIRCVTRPMSHDTDPLKSRCIYA